MGVPMTGTTPTLTEEKFLVEALVVLPTILPSKSLLQARAGLPTNFHPMCPACPPHVGWQHEWKECS